MRLTQKRIEEIEADLDELIVHGQFALITRELLDEREERFTAPIVCICGSTKFKQAWIAENARLTGEGNIVLAVGLWGHHERVFPDAKTKAKLDDLHKRKIDLCDWVWVLDVGGYIGESTRSEIEYAEKLGRPIRYLSKEFPNYKEPVDLLESNNAQLRTDNAALKKQLEGREREIEQLEKDCGDYEEDNRALRNNLTAAENELAQWKPDEKYEAEDARIIAELEAMSEEELDEQLRAVGIDPDEAMRRVTAVVKACKRMTEERDRADAAEKELAEIKATRIGQIISDNEILKDLSEGAVLQRDEARKALAAVQGNYNRLRATIDLMIKAGPPPSEVLGKELSPKDIYEIMCGTLLGETGRQDKARAILDTGKKDK